MTKEDLQYAAYWHIPVVWTGGDFVIESSQIVQIAERYATEEEIKFRIHPAYWLEISVLDRSGNSWITVRPEELSPADPAAFERRKAEYLRRKAAANAKEPE